MKILAALPLLLALVAAAALAQSAPEPAPKVENEYEGQESTDESTEIRSGPNTGQSWAEDLANMKAEFAKAKGAEAATPDGRMKLVVWLAFDRTFSRDNPESTEDDEMREFVTGRIRALTMEYAMRTGQKASARASKSPLRLVLEVAQAAALMLGTGLVLGTGAAGLLHLFRFRFSRPRLKRLYIGIPATYALLCGMWLVEETMLPRSPVLFGGALVLSVLLTAILPCLLLARRPV